MGSYAPEELDVSLWADFEAAAPAAQASDDSMAEIAREQVVAAIRSFDRLTGRSVSDEEKVEGLRPHGGNTTCIDGSDVFPLIRRVDDREALVVHYNLGAVISRFVVDPDSIEVKREDFKPEQNRFTEPIDLDGMPAPLEQATIAAKLKDVLQLAIQADMTRRLA